MSASTTALNKNTKNFNIGSKTLKIALVGNPNCGKTTLFNELTGSNQHVGNWPGVTVEKRKGVCVLEALRLIFLICREFILYRRTLRKRLLRGFL